jgi:hypothetical protein
MLTQRLRFTAGVIRPLSLSLTISRSIAVPYRKMAGVPSTYDGTRLPHAMPHVHH